MVHQVVFLNICCSGLVVSEDVCMDGVDWAREVIPPPMVEITAMEVTRAPVDELQP